MNPSSDLGRRLSEAVERMPAFPKSVQRVLELTRDINCAPKELVSVIEKDPVMTIKILKALNSAYYNFPKKITSVNQSVAYLGLNTVKNLALRFAAIGILPKRNGAGFDIQRYLLHSLLTASLAKQLCQKIPDTDSLDAYIAGLLHDFGKVVFAQFLPGEFKLALERSQAEERPLFAVEDEVIGADHTVVGSMLAEKWQFPKALIECIRHHHDMEGDLPVRDCLVVADEIAKAVGAGEDPAAIDREIPDHVAARWGDSYAEVVRRIGDINNLMEEAQFFAQIEATA